MLAGAGKLSYRSTLPLHLFFVFLEQNINYGYPNVGGNKMSTEMNQDLEIIEELIRTADGYLSPEYPDDYTYLYNKDVRDRLYGSKPDCFLKMQGIGREFPTLFLICNRYGHKDAKVIDISRRVVRRLMSDERDDMDVNDLQGILGSLDRAHSVYSKDIPKPPGQAGRKAYVSRMMNNIKRHLDVYKGN